MLAEAVPAAPEKKRKRDGTVASTSTVEHPLPQRRKGLSLWHEDSLLIGVLKPGNADRKASAQ